MDRTQDAVGGDLIHLWNTTNEDLPRIQNVYNAQLETIAPVAGSPDTEKYGQCHPWWDMLAQELQRAMVTSAESLEKSSQALNAALQEFAYIDGDTAKGMTDAGEQLEELINSSDKSPTPVNPLSDGYDAPAEDFVKPDGWSEDRDG